MRTCLNFACDCRVICDPKPSSTARMTVAHILDSTAASPQQLYIARRALRSSYSSGIGSTFPVLALDSVKSEKSGEVDPGILIPPIQQTSDSKFVATETRNPKTKARVGTGSAKSERN